MSVHALLRTIFSRQVLRPEEWVEIHWHFHLIEQHVQKKIVQRRHVSCLESFFSFISFKLFNILKLLLNHLFSITFYQIWLFLKTNQTSSCLTDLFMKTKLLMLYFDLFSFRKNKITSLERSTSAFIALAKILAHTTC